MRVLTFGKRTQFAGSSALWKTSSTRNPDEFYRRMEKIDMDAVLDTNYIVVIIRTPPYPFRTTGYTSGPSDGGQLMEGRIAFFWTAPLVLTLPYCSSKTCRATRTITELLLHLFFVDSAHDRFFMTITVPGLMSPSWPSTTRCCPAPSHQSRSRAQSVPCPRRWKPLSCWSCSISCGRRGCGCLQHRPGAQHRGGFGHRSGGGGGQACGRPHDHRSGLLPDITSLLVPKMNARSSIYGCSFCFPPPPSAFSDWFWASPAFLSIFLNLTSSASTRYP